MVGQMFSHFLHRFFDGGNSRCHCHQFLITFYSQRFESDSKAAPLLPVGWAPGVSIRFSKSTVCCNKVDFVSSFLPLEELGQWNRVDWGSCFTDKLTPCQMPELEAHVQLFVVHYLAAKTRQSERTSSVSCFSSADVRLHNHLVLGFTIPHRKHSNILVVVFETTSV